MRYFGLGLSLASLCLAVGCPQPSTPPAASAAQATAEANGAATSSRIAGEDALSSLEPSQLEGDAGRADAREIVAAALSQAKQSDKRLLVYYGADWCVWCDLLEQCLEAHRDVLAADYVMVKVDESTMKNTDELGEPWGKSQGDGIPWMAILDSEGKPLVTSNDSPTGINIGHPVEAEELDHFMAMLKKTAQHLTPEQLADLRKRWEKFTDQQGRELFQVEDVEIE